MKSEYDQTQKLVEEYLGQVERKAARIYEDEIRAEADLCHECCSCCRVMVKKMLWWLIRMSCIIEL